MRISDWSSYVCSSDLPAVARQQGLGHRLSDEAGLGPLGLRIFELRHDVVLLPGKAPAGRIPAGGSEVGGYLTATLGHAQGRQRSEERRVGNKYVRTCSSRWTRYTQKKNN